jgi:uncharacterized protein (DUF1800 family)
MSLSLSSQDAWQPLPQSEWNAEAAAHLLRRAGWSAKPDEVDRAVSEGLPKTLDRLFPESPALMPMPSMVSRIQEEEPTYVQKIREAQPADRRILQREQRERAQTVMQNMTIKWLQYSAQPENAAYQKWILFLSDVYVVSFEKVVNPPLIYDHFDIIGKNGLGAAPVLTKAISRSPAMVLFLDLNQNQPKAPNENFARELFELFVLGEGNYTEADIKEAAKAFTGYRTRPLVGDFSIVPKQHDEGPKTVFGKTGNFEGDDIIDLAYTLPAAGAFLPHELVKFYLSDTMLPKEYLYSLGGQWKDQGAYNLRWLALAFFGSRIFYAPEFRSNFIKSPVQYYLGLVQNLNLDVTPVPRFVINPMRQMGQVLFVPPNVRGWVGGRNWINSGSLNARRALVTTLFTPLDEDNMNADEQLEIVAARTQGADHFTVDPDQLDPLLSQPTDKAIRDMLRSYLAMPPSDDVRVGLDQLITSTPAETQKQHARQLMLAAESLLQTPEYQLC